MATLENIRKRGPLVAAVIGFALLAFILGDFSKLFSSGNPYIMAEVNGVEIDSRDYEEQVQTTINTYKANYNMQSLTQSQTDQIREMVWNNMVQNILLEEQYETIGLDVSSDELFELMQGRNVDPMVMRERAFINEQTGMFDPSRVVALYKNINQMDPQSKAYLLDLEDRIRENRKIRKYLTLVSKGLYVPKPFAENEFKNRNYLVDFDYVGKPYSTVPDSIIRITNSDLKAYYNEHKEEYEQEASRDIVYVTFDILPSQKDSLNTLDWINETAKDFKNTKDNGQFINFNSDESFNPKHFKKGEIENAEVDSFLFAADTGEVYGPYFEDGAYKLAKLIEIKDLPDSIEAKHILIAINQQSIPDLTKAKLVADSLKQAIEGGVDFAVVAKEYSADKQTMEKGGELGWITEEQKLIFDTLLNSKLNKIILLEQNYGVHLLVKTDQSEFFKKVQVGILGRTIAPSSETYQKTFARAAKFAGENRSLKKFEETVTKENLTKRLAPGLTRSGTFIPGLESPRILIKWAFKAKTGDVSDVKELGKRYVVASLTAIKEKGIAPLEQVENSVKMAVIKEKKAEILLKQMQEAMSGNLASLAQKMSLEVKEAKNISFTSRQIPGIGYEPAVIAKAVTSEKDKVSEPIKGENGVYAITVKIITPSMSTENVDLEIDRKRMLQTLQSRTYPNPQFGGTGEVIEALKEAADIDDEKRSDFY